MYQVKIGDHIDYEKKGLKQILELNPNFLVNYFNQLYNEPKLSQHSKNVNLSFVWDLDISEQIDEALEIIIAHEPYFGMDEDILSIFFDNLNEIQNQKVDKYISNFINKNFLSHKKMSIIFDVVRNYVDSHFEEYMLLYLQKNQNLDTFKKIYWRGNGGTVHIGDVNFGDMEAEEWINIYNIIKKAENQLKLVPIKSYVKKHIDNIFLYADEERKREFLSPDW